MELEGGKSYNKHKLKVYAYIKAKRLIRKANKTFSNKNNAAMAMSMRRGGDEDDEDDLDRIKEEMLERKEKNRIWRENRERQRRRQLGEYSEDEEDEEDGADTQQAAAHTRQLDHLRGQLSCASCQCSLSGKVWQCQVGHPACKNCVELCWLEDEDKQEDEHSVASSRRTSKQSQASLSSVDRFSMISDDTVKEMIEKMTEEELLDLLDKCSDTSSTVTFSGPTLTERQLEEIDWFVNTIEIRKDAIKPYHDYHNPDEVIRAAAEEKQIEADRLAQESLSDDNNETIEDETEWRVLPMDELELKNQQRLREELQESARPDQTDSGNETLSSSTSNSFSGGRPSAKCKVGSIDWFQDTIEIKKDNIRPYTDYHAVEEAMRNVRINDDVEIFASDDDDEQLDSASVLAHSRTRSTRSSQCRACQAPIVGRNLFVEGLVKEAFLNE